jgi:hypothetical protein
MAPLTAAPHVLQAEDPSLGGSPWRSQNGIHPTPSKPTLEMTSRTLGPRNSPIEGSVENHNGRHTLRDITNKIITHRVTVGSDCHNSLGEEVWGANWAERQPEICIVEIGDDRSPDRITTDPGPESGPHNKNSPNDETGTLQSMLSSENEPGQQLVSSTRASTGLNPLQTNSEEEGLGLSFGPNMQKYLKLQDQNMVDLMIGNTQKQLEDGSCNANIQQLTQGGNSAKTQKKTKNIKSKKGTLKFMSINV